MSVEVLLVLLALAVAAYVLLARWTRHRRSALGIADGVVVSADDSFIRGRRCAPRALKRATFDNITLVPAPLLPFTDQWERLAKSLPAGEALLLVPADATSLRRMLRVLVPQLRARGRQITAIPAERLAQSSPLPLRPLAPGMKFASTLAELWSHA